MAVSTDRALHGAFAPITSLPTAFSGSAGTASALLIADKAGDAIRRVSIVNQHATQTLAVVFVPAAQAAAGETVASGRPIPAGGSWDFVVHSSLRMLVVASGAGTTYGGIVSDDT